MSEYEEFENWFRSVMNGAISIEYNSTQFGWDACRELKDAIIEKQAKEIEALRIALINIVENQPKVGTDYPNLADVLFSNGVTDDFGNLTKLLTGESK